MLVALVVLVLAPATFAQSAAGVEHASPAAKGISISGQSENLRNDTTGGDGNTDHCGEIDPGTPCYANGGDEDDCPLNTSRAKCEERCACQYKKNVEECDGGKWCLDTVAAEKRACDANCIADWP